MASPSRINPIIQEKLNEKRKILSRQGSSAIYSPSSEESRKKYQQNIVKTPYIIMASSEEIQTKQVYYKDGEPVETDKLVDENFPKGFYMLSNQEYSSNLENGINNSNINVGTDLYNARNLNSEDKVQYRPAPGIKDLTSEFTSTNNTQFNRKVTVNFVCYSLKDLEILVERFMTFNRRVFVQWGWATNEKINPLINQDGKVNYTGDDPNNYKSEITRLQEEVITRGRGDLDAIIGYTQAFNYTLREDGGFDCTTELLAQGVNILDSVLEQDNRNVNEVKKGLKSNVNDLQYSMFTTEINDLHNIGNKDIGGEETTKYNANIFSNLSTAEGGELDEDNEYKSINFKNLAKNIKFNDNFIITENIESRFEPGTWRKPGQTIDETTIDPNECWIKWGWFEDNVINKYFALVDTKGDIVSSFRSIVDVNNATSDSQKDSLTTLSTYGVASEDSTTIANILLRSANTDTALATINKKFGTDYKEIPDLFESVRLESDKKFKTTDINQFLFPGKFNIDFEILSDSRLAAGKALYFAPNEDVYKQYDVERGSDKEKKLVEEYKEYRENYEKTFLIKDKAERIEELKKIIKDSQSTVGNLNEIRETGIDKYLFLIGLEQVSSQLRPFDIEDSFDDSERGSGYLRNIFINIGHLQSIFGNTSAVTLGETLNVLFNSLSQNIPQELNSHLVVRYETLFNLYRAEPRKPGKDYSDKVNTIINSKEENQKIYEFPVHQQDSIVLSQELTTDLSSTQFQVLMSKNLASQAQFIDKKNISAEHQLNFSQTDINGNKSDNPYVETGLIPAYKDSPAKGLSWGNNITGYFSSGRAFGKLGSDESWPINLWKGKSSNNTKEAEEALKIRQQIDAHDTEPQKDLEEATKVFQDLPIPYDINGRLKPEYFKNMTYEVQYQEEDEDDTPKLKVSDYGFIGLTTTLTLTGIAGIYPSNIFTTSYLPKKFKVNNIANEKTSCHFWTTGVTQNCSAESWTTQIEARMAWRFVEDE
tara:strand:+ start:60 stop:3038 length:2979 start_codon:yes stop_codon:yes gene_type:complete